jgi:integrase
MVRDPYKNEERYKSWKGDASDFGIKKLSKANSNLILGHLNSLEEQKCHFNTINTRRVRIIKLFKKLEAHGVNDVLKLKESQAYEILKGESVDDLKGFSAFWRWLVKKQKKLYLETKGKKGQLLTDICEEFNTKREENSFVYFTFEQLKEMMPYFTQDEQVRLLFMFDTIIRSPTELQNVKFSDIHDDFKELQIREETSKTFGRVIKLLLCSDELRDYVQRNKLKQDDYLFNFDPAGFNKKLKQVAKQVFGDRMSKAGEPYSKLSLYDFRHSGAIYWRLGAYKSKIDALMYRGGWNNLTILNYYTKKIGMQDSIEKQDLIIGVDKNEVEKLREDGKELREKYDFLSSEVLKMNKLLELMNEAKQKKQNKFRVPAELMSNFSKKSQKP